MNQNSIFVIPIRIKIQRYVGSIHNYGVFGAFKIMQGTSDVSKV